jgi:hypothetical protein
VSWVKRGTITGAPEIIELNGKFDWTNPAEVQRVTTKMSTMTVIGNGPSRPTELYMAGDFPARAVNPQSTGFTNLYQRMIEFDKQVSADIDKMAAGDAKTAARRMLDISNNNILKACRDLRDFTRKEKLQEEMTKKFSTGKFDKVYEYYDEVEKKTKYFAPIDWKFSTPTIWGRTYKILNRKASEDANPQMLDKRLKDKLDAHVDLFNNDGEGTDKKGRGLLTYDVKYAGTNGRHQNIIDVQNRVGAAYQKNCK